MGTKTVESSIVNVTVYRKGVYVTRRVRLSLGEGKNIVEVEKLPGTIDPDSVQVGVDKDVVCQQVSYDRNKNEFRVDETADLLTTEIDEKIRTTRDKINIIDLRLEMLKKAEIKYDMAGGIGAIEEFNKYNGEQIAMMISERSDLDCELNKLVKKKEEEKNQKTKSIWKSLPGTIYMELSSASDHETEIEIQYFDQAASWRPHYDIRREDGSSTIAFILKGNIIQSTGEDWIDVPMCISTGDYSQKRYRGELTEWRLGAPAFSANVPKPLMASGRRDMVFQSANNLDATMCMMAPSPVSQNTAELPVEVTFNQGNVNSAVIDNQNSIIYELPERCTVNDRSGNETVFINSTEIECVVADFTTPKLDCSAFMVARVTDYSKYNFLNCGANVFLNNRFVGKTVINPEGTDNTMLISLGPDEKVEIKRIALKQHTSKSFIGSTTNQEYEYAIKMNNRKSEPVVLNVTDQIPVSYDARYTVEVTNLSKGELDYTTGKVKWNIEIGAGEEQEIRLAFKVVTKK